MKKVLLLLGAFMLVSSLVAVGCTPAPTPAAPTPAAPTPAAPTPAAPTPAPTSAEPTGKTYTLTFAWVQWGSYNDEFSWGPGGWWQRLVDQYTNGRVRLKIIPKMFSATEVLDAISTGKADMGEAYTPYYDATYPQYNWGAVPGIVDGIDIHKAADQIAAINDDPRMISLLEKSYRDIGIQHLYEHPIAPSATVWTNKEIKTLDDLKGMKIRVSGRMKALTLEAYGAKPVSMPAAEVTQSLLTGVIDATQNDYLFGLQSLGLKTKYVVNVPIGPGHSMPVLMNAKAFDSLPPDLQVGLKQAAAHMRIKSAGDVRSSIYMGQDLVKAAGITHLKLSEADATKAAALTKDVEQTYLKNAGPYGAQFLQVAKDVVAKFNAFEMYPR